MSDEPAPFIEGEPPPSPQHILANVHHVNGDPPQLMWILPDVLEASPPRHADVDALLPVLRWQWRHVGPYATWCRSFEDWELGFMRDSEPGREAAIFIQVTYAFLQLAETNPDVDRAIWFQALMHIINGRDDMVQPPHVAEMIKQLMADVPPFLKDLDNFGEDGRLLVGPEHLR